MAARVGTGVTGEGSGTSTTIASAAKATTTGNLLTAWLKVERATGSITITSAVDTAGNAWNTVALLQHPTSTFLWAALLYAANITGNAANVLTVTLSQSCDWRRLLVEEWSGLATSSVEDGNEQTQTGTGSPFDTAAITTTQSGLVVLGVGAGGTLSSLAGAGTPTFSLGNTISDTTFGYLISNAAQSVTPSITGNGGGGEDITIAQAFKDAAVATVPQPSRLFLQAIPRAVTF